MRMTKDRLDAFYQTRRGRLTEAMIARRVAALWGNLSGLDVLGFGYPPNLIAPCRASARRVIWAGPAAQGVNPWPAHARGASLLTDDDRLPFMDAIFDRIILVHALEESESPRALLREIWRVCAPAGRVIVVAANRRGPWALAENTPFGHGRAFTRRQLSAMLKDALFQPAASACALYAPPLDWPLITVAGEGWERAGERLWPALGGLVLMEAVKSLYVQPDPVPGLKAKTVKTVPARQTGLARTPRSD